MAENALKLPPNFPGPAGHPEVIEVLEAALAEARAGRLAGVGIVYAVGPGGTRSVAAGAFMPEVYLGCDMLKDAIRKSLTGQRSPILRPM